jgi:hypothetical protein
MTEATDIAVRLARAKWAYVTRNVDRDLASQLLAGDHVPNAGDLLLARVDQRGQHWRPAAARPRSDAVIRHLVCRSVHGSGISPVLSHEDAKSDQ